LITDEGNADAHSWNVESAADPNLDGDIPWVLIGSPENVEKAKTAVQKAVEEALNSKIGYLVLPDPSTYRFVVGQAGAKVNSIRKATGCNITIPRSQQEGEAIEIVGTQDGIEEAKEMVLEAVKEGTSRA
jgi:rRNA processing protein Krr1/Pno1